MKAENKIQQEIVQWFRANYYKKGVIFSVPNERAGGYLAMKDLLLTGLLSGVSDLIVVLPNKVLFVEVKNEIGTQKPNQIKFEKNVQELNHEYHLVRSLLEFKAIIK
jgi:hypothetical protein